MQNKPTKSSTTSLSRKPPTSLSKDFAKKYATNKRSDSRNEANLTKNTAKSSLNIANPKV